MLATSALEEKGKACLESGLLVNTHKSLGKPPFKVSLSEPHLVWLDEVPGQLVAFRPKVIRVSLRPALQLLPYHDQGSLAAQLRCSEQEAGALLSRVPVR